MNTETVKEVKEEEQTTTPGLLLRQKRESLGLSQKQIANRLRLRVTIIDALETDNFNIDKVTTFTRGYVRSYAKTVGLDEETILNAYDHYCGQRNDGELEELDMRSFSRKTSRQQHNNRVNLISVLVVLVLIGISSVWWYQNQQQDSLMPKHESSHNSDLSTDSVVESKTDDLNAQSATVSSAADDKEQAKVEQTIAPEQPASDSDSKPEQSAAADNKTDAGTPAADSATQTVTDSTDTESTTQSSAKTSTPATVASSSLVMSFQADCWVSVKDATGKTLSIGLKKAGKSLHLQGQQPLSVVLGAPESVSITFAGKPVDLSRYTSGKVARLTLP